MFPVSLCVSQKLRGFNFTHSGASKNHEAPSALSVPHKVSCPPQTSERSCQHLAAFLRLAGPPAWGAVRSRRGSRWRRSRGKTPESLLPSRRRNRRISSTSGGVPGAWTAGTACKASILHTLDPAPCCPTEDCCRLRVGGARGHFLAVDQREERNSSYRFSHRAKG